MNAHPGPVRTTQEPRRSEIPGDETAGRPERIARLVDRLARWLARHWLATFNLIVAVFIGLPVLAPVLAHAGATGPARVIYALYAPTCHQLPERSLWLFGPQAIYSTTELEARHALPAGLSIWQRMVLRFSGNQEVGHKIALCQRDLAIYGSILLNGLLFGLLRGGLRRKGSPGTYAAGRKLPKMPLWLFGLLSIPMFLDGGTQLLGWRESSWLLRLATGGLFGAAVMWLAYPYVQEAMDDLPRSPLQR